VLFEVLLILVQHSIEPGEEFLGAVVGVQNDRDTVDRSDFADVVGSSNGTSDTSFLVLVCNALS